jgi:predicted MFS family arabinose efflux permease
VPTKTDWRVVFALVMAGVVGACQVGKAAIAVPLLREDLGLSLVAASWVVGTYATLGALAGLSAGIAVSFVGARTAAVGGLLAIAIGSALGAVAPGAAVLLLSRVVEGCGFLGVVIAIPTLLRGVAVGRDRDLALVFWSAYMPAGTALMMVAGPLLTFGGWRGLWMANAALAACYAAVVWWLMPAQPRGVTQSTVSLRAIVFSAFESPGPLLLAFGFGIYTFQYFALTGLLPTLLVERMGLSIGQAGTIAAVTVLANMFGNLAAGLLLRRGVPLWIIMLAAFAFLGVAAFGIFNENYPVILVATLASASLAITGLIPASIFAASPRLATAPHLLAVALGLIVQASNIGQLLGPAALGMWAEHYGWSSAPVLFGIVALSGIVVAMLLRRLLPVKPMSGPQ